MKTTSSRRLTPAAFLRILGGLVCTIPSLGATPGAVDPGFNPNANAVVNAIAVQPDGRIVLGGEFTTMGGASRNRIARVNANGTLDTAFNPDANATVRCAIVQPDGMIVLAGDFTTVGGQARSYVARVDANGALDAGFSPAPNGGVFGLALQPDGKIVVAGDFTAIGGTTRNRLARLNADGSLDALNPNVSGLVKTVALQPDGKIVFGGAFSSVGGSARGFLARLNANGTLDSFNPGVNSVVESVAVEADGRILIGGNTFTTVGGVSRDRLARVDATGALDPSFNPGAGYGIFSMTAQTDGRIIIGGGFTFAGGATRNYAARINPDGSLDAGFDPSASSVINAAAVQADGKILIGGAFTQVGGVARNRIVRLENDPATQGLTVTGPGGVQWLRGGTSPEAIHVTFELSTDGGNTWTLLGSGARIAGGWNLNGLNLPTAGQIRARARTAGASNNGSSGLIETISPFSITIPEIEISGGTPAVPILNGDLTPATADGTDFGSVAVLGNTSVTHTFTINNLGTGPLSVTSATSSSTEFTVTGFGAGTLGAGGATTFSVLFNPAAGGLRTANITVASDDTDEASYVFAVQGNGTVAPEMLVRGLSVTILNGDLIPTGNDNTYFGNAVACGGAPVTHTFTIMNYGTAPLNLTGSPLVVVGGANAADFVVGQPTNTSIPGGGGWQDFTVTFTPGSTGTRTATLSIATNDPTTSPYTFAISGDGIAPEIDIAGGTTPTSIADGDTSPSLADGTNFGSVNVAASVTRTFTITNTGPAPLNLTGNPKVAVSGANPGEFVVSGPGVSTLPVSGSTTFTVTFTPQAPGVRTATLTIASNDCDEYPYDFAIQGTGVGVPEIDVKGNNTSIAAGSSTPALANHTDFGSTLVGGPPVPRTFTIVNNGTGDLHLTVTPLVAISGAHAADFSVSPPPAATVAAGGGVTTFTVNFAPGGAGLRTATLTIANDDADENPYIFAIQGAGVYLAEIDVRDNGIPQVSIPSGSMTPSFANNTKFGSSPVSFAGALKYYDIVNTGNAPLSVTSITSSAPGEFLVAGASQPLPASLNGGGSMFFSVLFLPAGLGVRTATITVANDDADENPYIFAVEGNGTGEPEITVRGNGGVIANGDLVPSPFDDTLFGSVLWPGGASVTHTFTIVNDGLLPLHLTSTPLTVTISGPNAAEFSLTQPALTTIPPNGASTTFNVTFDPAGPGLRTATITILSDDADEGAYTFAIEGTGQNPPGKPNITISGNSQQINAGDITPSLIDGTDFGGAVFTGTASVTHSFTILNSGLAPLLLGPVTVTGANTSDFIVTAQPSTFVGSTLTTTFTVKFDPSGPGLRTATLSVTSNVPTLSPYTFNIRGTGYHAYQWVPGMKVNGAGLIIVDGDATPSATDGTHFGSTAVAGGIVVRTFTIGNSGLAPLTLTGAPAVSVGGPHATDFSVIQPTSTTINSGGQTSFTVLFNPSAAGTRNATISIANNDAPKNPYNFSIRGSGIGWWWGWGPGSGWAWTGGSARWVPIADLSAGTRELAVNDAAPSVGSAVALAWGANNLGQLGDGGSGDRFSPAPVSTGGLLAGRTVSALAVGQNHVVALCSDGALVAWGQGAAGQLGHGATSGSPVPVAVSTAGALAGRTVVAIAAGSAHSLALCSDGTVVAWGQGTAGQLGHGATTSTTVPVVVNANGALSGRRVVSIAAGEQHSVALCSDGAIASWGDNRFGQLGNGTAVNSSLPVLANMGGAAAGPGGRPAVAIAAGASHTLAAFADGSVAGWGRNQAGQLGDGSTADRVLPVWVETSGALNGRMVVAIAAGSAHSLALCFDGTLAAWGANAVGQLGNGSTAASAFPVTVNVAGELAEQNVVAISAGATHSLALTAEGMLAAWGDNSRGQLGSGGPAGSRLPIVVPSTLLPPDSRSVGVFTGPLSNSTLVLQAPLAPASIALSGNEVPILNGASPASLTDHTDFGRVTVGGGAQERTFTITNNGNAPLRLTGTPPASLSGANAADFAVVLAPSSSIAPGSASSFVVRFTPGGAGARQATLTVASDDASQNPFTFPVQGTGVSAGGTDPGFNPALNNGVYATAVLPDGGNVIGGLFTSSGQTAWNRIARIAADGTLDLGFNPGAGDQVGALVVMADGAITLGGSFTTVGGVARNSLARVSANGIVDVNYNPDVNGPVIGLALQPDGKLVVAGAFTAVGGLARSKLARLNADGTPDAGFNPGANRTVYAAAVQTDGKIIIAGNFDTVAGATRGRIARLLPDGGLDTTFDPNANSDVTCLAIQPNGRIVLAGQFTSIGGTPHNRLARLNADGSVDPTFSGDADGAVYTMALQADGKIIVGGAFTNLGGAPHTRIARLNPDGTPDAGFNPGAGDVVFSTALQADGKVVVGGFFAGASGNFVARLDNDSATGGLAATAPARVQWLRGGAAPETLRVTFELSADHGQTWSPLGSGVRIAGGWELTGLSLPDSGSIRARGRTVSGAYSGSSGLIEQVASFNFGIAPTINVQPQDQTVAAGASVALRVAASGDPAPTYEWRKGGAAGSTAVTGATGATLTLSSAQVADAGSYFVVVTNSRGSVTSSVAALTVTPSVAPAITTQPAARAVVAGGSAGFSVSATGTPAPAFQWRRAGVPIAGATNAAYVIPAVAAADAGSYDVLVSNVAGTVNSSAVELTVNLPPAIVTQPSGRGAGIGTGVLFSVVASGTPPLAYQWSKDGANLTGATSPALALASVPLDAAGQYRVVVSNPFGSMLSEPATLAVLNGKFLHAVNGQGFPTAGGTVTIRNTLTYTDATSALGWQVLLPAGWIYAGGSGNEGSLKPFPGDTNFLEWAWTAIPASPIEFSYTLRVPAGVQGDQPLVALAIVREKGLPAQIVAQPDPLLIRRVLAHSADLNVDLRIDLVELTRVIELYNTRNGTARTGCYQVEAGAEDGFAADPTRPESTIATLTRHHSADSNRDGKLSLLELTRVIELYNFRSGTTRTGQYRVQAGTEDGFAAGP